MQNRQGIWVVTPTLNQLEWLRLCVASVRDQTYGLNIRVHHHVQDGGSSDGTVEFLEEQSELVATQHSVFGTGFTFSFESEPDGGMYDAVNRGWRRSTNDFTILAHLNSDEQYLYGALAVVVAFFDDNSDTDILVGDAVVLNDQCEYVCSRRVLRPSLSYTLIYSLSTFTAATFVCRRSVIEGQWFFDSNWRAVEDRAWMLRRLRERVSLRALGVYTSAFVDTGKNLALTEIARQEENWVRRTAPIWLRALSFVVLAVHRGRRLVAGHYLPKAFFFARFRPGNSRNRMGVWVNQPKAIWSSRLWLRRDRVS